ncbi:FecR domain-containing protein, partial [Barnesiella intestinihominis]
LTVKFDHDETIDEVLSILEGILQNMKYKKNNDIIFIN